MARIFFLPVFIVVGLLFERFRIGKDNTALLFFFPLQQAMYIKYKMH